MTVKNYKNLYAAFKARDARFDGHFFVGVSSTKIYCRPVCKAKMPAEKNCTFYSSAAEAERDGYRPCLLCRPELAPGSSWTDAAAGLAGRAARLIEQNCGSGQNIGEFAKLLGCSERHLRRVFSAEYNVSPVRYLQTCRLLAAKNLLADTNMSVLDVAMTAGFGSLRRFNCLFGKEYGMPPTAVRKQRLKRTAKTGVELALGYRPPYNWDAIIKFFSERAVSGVEAVENGEYYRAVRLTASNGTCVSGWIKVGNKPEKNILTVAASENLLHVMPQILARIKRLFDLYCDPEIISEKLIAMNKIRSGLFSPGIRIPGSFDTFETSVRAILGQQISVKAAAAIAGKIVKALGTPVDTGFEKINAVFPSPEKITEDGARERLQACGVTKARSETIYRLAEAVTAKKINLDYSADPEKEIGKLISIPGVGNWTAQYIALRVMGWPDAFPETDAGIKKALSPNTPDEILQIAGEWRPWRGYAAHSLWNSI